VQPDKEKWVRLGFVLIVLVAVILRFYNLPLRPIHHDEASGHHTFSNDIFALGKYVYDPVYHGPFMYHVVALFYKMFGVSEISIRGPAALFGVLLLFFVWFLRHWVGNMGMLLIAALIAVSPAQVYFSRFALHDSFFDFFTLAVVVSLLYYLKRPSKKGAALLGMSVGFLFTVKENAYFIGALLGFYAAMELLLFSSSGGIIQRIKGTVQLLWKNKQQLGIGILSFAVPFTLIYTTFFKHPDNIYRSITLPLTKWYELATTWSGHFKPASYYLHLLIRYEFAAIALGLLGLYFCIRQFKTASYYRFITVWVILNTLLYFTQKYKTPWLTTHLMLPFAVAAGFAMHAVMQKWWKRDFIIGCCILLIASLGMCIYASFYDYDNNTNKEFAYVQAARGIFPLISDIEQYGKPPWIRVVANEYAWPLFWYLRQHNMPAGHQQNATDDMKEDVIITTLQLNLTGYTIKEYYLGHHGPYKVYYKDR